MKFCKDILFKFFFFFFFTLGFSQAKPEVTKAKDSIIKINNSKIIFPTKLKKIIPKKAFTAIGCPNASFSQGDFTNWVGTTGYYGSPSETLGISADRHTIIDQFTTDVRTCNNLTIIPPGEQYSAKLGNESGGGQSEKLSYSITVTPENALFIYKYAAVLQDPGHTPNSQPGFTVQLLDVTNLPAVPITENCGVYNVYAGQADQDFQECGDVKWLNWKTIALNLTPYIGRDLNIEFITRDCVFELHFGYAYISAKCSALRLSTKTCEGSNSVILSAPEGFSSYQWYQNGTLIGSEKDFEFSVGTYPIGTVFECIITAISNGVECPVTISTVLGNPIQINPSFTTSLVCGGSTLFSGSEIQFQDTSTIQNDVIATWEWRFGDNTTSNEQNPIKIYENPGNYTVTLIVTSLNGCSKTLQFPIIILANNIPPPVANSPQNVCFGLPNLNQNLIATGLNIQWYESAVATNPIPLNTSLVNYTFLYVSQTIGGCESPRVKVDIIFVNSQAPTGNQNQNFCSQNNPTLQNIIIQGTNIKWYNSELNSVELPLNTPLANGQSYYATQNTGCGESNIRLKITISFDSSNLSGSPIQYFCQINNPKVADLVLNSSTINWYATANGASQLNINLPLQNGTTYYASETTNQDCTPRFAVKVVFDTYPVLAANFEYTFCNDKNETLQNITNFNSKKWYATLNSNSELNISTELTNEATFYFAQIDAETGCENPNRYVVNVKSIPCDVEVYNTLTLNNNNQNDFLSIKNIEFFLNNQIEIFDKYGKLVYKMNNYGQNKNFFYGIAQGNDVYLKDKKLPTGTYYYVLNIKNNSININKTKKGFLYIINNE